MAINELIKLKNPKGAIYDEKNLDYPDYDIYTPNPIYDMIYITNKLYDLGEEDKIVDIYGAKNDLYVFHHLIYNPFFFRFKILGGYNIK